eukprot:scaffold374_cov380-Prasinococcus_capsulatus_cf.AAC.3
MPRPTPVPMPRPAPEVPRPSPLPNPAPVRSASSVLAAGSLAHPSSTCGAPSRRTTTTGRPAMLAAAGGQRVRARVGGCVVIRHLLYPCRCPCRFRPRRRVPTWSSWRRRRSASTTTLCLIRTATT